MKNDTAGVASRTSLLETTTVTSSSPVSSSSFRASRRPLRGMMTPRGSFTSGTRRSTSASRCPSVATMRSVPASGVDRNTPERLKRVSSEDTANSVLSTISRSVPAARRTDVPSAVAVPRGNWGKSLGSRLTMRNFDRPASRSTQPTWADLRVTSSADTSRAIS